MHCFYVDSFLREVVVLCEEESAHCARALRLGVGDAVLLSDGAGGLAEGVLVGVGKRGVEVRVTRRSHYARRVGQQTVLAVAPTKNADRMEWLLEKVTEVGCGAVVPLGCERGVRQRLNGERLHRVAVSALKQSQGAYLPKIYPMMRFEDFLTNFDTVCGVGMPGGGASYLRVVAHCAEGERSDLAHLLGDAGPRPLAVLIGPEGDFSDGELAMARAHGFLPVSIGSARLRTETAALAAVVLAGIRR